MQCNVAGLLKGPTGEQREMVFEEHLPIELSDAALKGPVRGRANLIREPLGVFVEAEIATTLAMRCARCLTPIEHDLKLTITESFVPTVPIPGGPPVQIDDESDPATWINELHIVDLSEVVRQAIVLSEPLDTLCRTECQGLCPHCGSDLNEGRCGCEPEPDPRWDALRTIMDEESA